MKCPHPNCHETMEYWGPTKDEPDTGARAMPAGWWCPHGHFKPYEAVPSTAGYDVEPAFLEGDGPMVAMEQPDA